MSDIFYAYVSGEEIIDFRRKYYDDVGLILPHGTLLTRSFLPKRHGYKRVKIDFENLKDWNTYFLTSYRNHYDRDVSEILIESPNYPIEIWPTLPMGNIHQMEGVEILDRMKLYPGEGDFLPEWIPLHKVTVMAKEPFYMIQDLSFSRSPFLESVKLDNRMKYVGCDSFSNCPQLKKVVIGEDTVLHGKNCSRAFSNDPQLSTFIIIPNPNSQLMESAYRDHFLIPGLECGWFENCPKLSQLIIADTQYRIPVRHSLHL